MKKLPFRPKNPHDVLAIDPRAVGMLFDSGKVDAESSASSVGTDGLAIVSISGALEHHPSWWFDSYDDIVGRIEANLADESCKALVLCIDSPGGNAAGAFEAHRKIKSLRKEYDKPIYAYANEQMCSAAYAIGCAADEVWTPETGSVGSIGAVACIADMTAANKKAGIKVELLTTGERKGDGDPNKPLTDDVRAALQERVDHFGRVFFKSVAKARAMSFDAVEGLEAGVFMGKTAVKKGIADGVAGWDAFLAMVRNAHDLEAPIDEEPSAGSRPNEESQEKSMSKLLALSQAMTKAETALSNAKSEKELLAAKAAYRTATANLLAFEAKKYSKMEEEEDAEDEEAEDESEEDAEDEEADDESEEDESDAKKAKSKKAKAKKAKCKDKDDDDSDDDDDADEEEEDEEEEASASDRSSGMNAKSAARMFAICQKITGKSSVSACLGALQALKSQVKASTTLSKEVAAIKAERRAERVDSALAKAKKQGKVTPGQVASLRKQGLKDEEWLLSYLDELPKAVRSTDEMFTPREGTDGQAIGADAYDQQLQNRDMKKMFAQSKPVGMTDEDWAATLKKYSKSPLNGAPPRS